MPENHIEMQQMRGINYGTMFTSSVTINTTTATDLVVSKASNKPSQTAVWLFGISFITVIGLCSISGILLMRCLKKNLFNRFITFFVSVGVGSLSGSAFFHLLPHAFGLDDTGPKSFDYLHKSVAAIVGIYLFFFCEKLFKIGLEMRKRSVKKNVEIKQQLHPINNNTQLKSESEGTKNGHLTMATDSLLQHHQNNTNSSREQEESEQSIQHQSHALCVHDHDYKEGDSVIATVAWMIIFGDGLHNFLDGVIIGAAFTESLMHGISISVAVLCEEFPHELGDVAILINSGMSMKQALVYNLLSALTCYVGFVVGVLVGNISETSFAAYTHGFAGGMFLYISLASMMPEMKNAMEKALNVSLLRGLEVLGLQALGVVTGLLCMFVMARYGDYIQFS